jgi:NAD(P)H dehydrogenase (quinone)
MSKVAAHHCSSFGHIGTMAHAVAEGAREVGAQVDVKRAPETVPDEIALGAHFELARTAPIANVRELTDDDAIIVGSGTSVSGISWRRS